MALSQPKDNFSLCCGCRGGNAEEALKNKWTQYIGDTASELGSGADQQKGYEWNKDTKSNGSKDTAQVPDYVIYKAYPVGRKIKITTLS